MDGDDIADAARAVDELGVYERRLATFEADLRRHFEQNGMHFRG